jgi:hypothetical protein
MYPLHRVSVRGRERRGEDFDELEWFAIRAIAHAGLDSVPALRDFYGLDERLVELVVRALQSVGHLDRGGDGRLALTGLGRESLAGERRYEEYESRQVLYFDAFTCHPLPQRHYRLRFSLPAELEARDRALYSFEPWRAGALRDLLARPDRDAYNVADEVLELRELAVDTAYLPMHIVDARTADGGRALLVFSNVYGRRDVFFETLLRDHPEIVAPLREEPPVVEEAVERSLRYLDLQPGAYRLERVPGRGWRAIVPAAWLEGVRPDGVSRELDLGEYVLAAGYCVRLWSDDPERRASAAALKVLDRLEHVTRSLGPGEVRQAVEETFVALEAPAADVATLLALADRRRLGRAQERLEGAMEG